MPTNKKSFTPAAKGTGSFINCRATLATAEGEVNVPTFGDNAALKITIKIESAELLQAIEQYGSEAVMAALQIIPVSIKVEGKDVEKETFGKKLDKVFG